MHFQHKPVRLLTVLAVLFLFSGLNALMLPVAHASSQTTAKAAKDTLQILPKTLASKGIPTSTVSLYESTTKAATMQAQGCSAAHRAPGLIVLDWGQPVYFGGSTYGTYDFGGHDDTDTAIFHAVANFAYGAWSCRTPSTNIAIAIGQSNYYSGNAIPLTTAAWRADGRQWGIMVNEVQSFIAGNGYNVVAAFGAGDLEVQWMNFTLTSSLVDGYNSVTSRTYFDFGDAAPGWWSNYQIWYVAFGAKDDLPLPEIYYGVDATNDWEPLSVWACHNEGDAIDFKGTLTENVPSTDSPSEAFRALQKALASNSCTAKYRSGMIFSSEIFHS
jgi:hypothetical protein